ncbi:MAG: restriction endonuclease subunit S [Planctomycetota bacterium]|nr:restriction endonuclease subunit S [Planctomycetota bacterium]
MSRWKHTRLGDLCEVFSGYPFQSARFSSDPDDVPLVKGENIGQGQILWEISKRWPRDEADELDRFRLQSDDVVLAMDRPWVPAGLKFARIRKSDPQALLVQRVARLRSRGGLEQTLLPYVIGSPGFVAYIQNIARGVGVPHISGKQIADFQLSLPPAVVQKRISRILLAYDDLIENNTRQIALLEQAATLLYEEWFVRLQFPGREHTKVVDSPVGPVPKGWRVVRLRDICTKIGSGATPRGGQSSYHQDGVTLIRSQNIYDTGFADAGLAYLDDNQASELSNVTVQPRDILLNITGASVARCCMIPERHLPARVNQHVMIIRVNPAVTDAHFVLAAINSAPRKKQLLAYSQVGATREALTKETVGNFQIVLPKDELLRQFADLADDASGQREVLSHQNSRLQTARDLLLPKLMSGEIEV